MFKNDKNAILLQHWTFAKSPSLKQTNSRTCLLSAFLSKGRGEHNCTFAAKHHQKKKSTELPNAPQPWNTKIKSINPALQQSNPPFAEQEGVLWKGLWYAATDLGLGTKGWQWGTFINFICSLAKIKLTNPFRACCKVTHFSRKHPRQLPFSRMCHFLCSYNNILSKGIAMNLHIYIRIDTVHRKDSRMMCIYNSRNQQKAFC